MRVDEPGVEVRFSDVADWVDGRLSADRAAEVAHAAATDPDRAADERWLRGFRDAAALPTTPPSPLVAQHLQQYFGRWVQAQAVLSAEVTPYRAVLLFDSSLDRPLAGVRGGSATVNLLFGCDVGDLVVDLQADDDGGVLLLGQVMLTEETAAPYFEVTAADDSDTRRTESDDLGRFRLAGLPAGPVEITASNGEVRISATVPLDHLHPGT